MAEEIPVWRQALQDKTHPLHQAAWLLFSEGWNGKLADRLPAEHRDEMIEFCYLLMETEELYLEKALGGGNAPLNAMQLLGHWHIEAAIPRILDLWEEEMSERIFMGAVPALISMGAAAIEPVLSFAAELDKNDQNSQIDVCEILSRAGKGDDRTYEYIRNYFESLPPSEPVLKLLAQKLLRCQPEKATAFLENCIKQNRYKRNRESFEQSIAQAKSGEL